MSQTITVDVNLDDRSYPIWIGDGLLEETGITIQKLRKELFYQ